MTPEFDHNTDRERLELALQVAGLGEFEWDVDRDVFVISDRLSAISGVPVGEMPAQGGAGLNRYVHPDDLAAFKAQQVLHLKGSDTYERRYRFIRPDDGRVLWMRAAGLILRDEAGKPRRVCGIIEDVTKDHLREDQREQLLAELDHRVKNVLATVLALAQQTAKRTTSLDAFLQTFTGRLKAMGSANELLTAARWRGAAIDHLAAAELGALAPSQTSWEGPELFLTPRAANALSLALHELATNAVKFGALSVETGHVSLRWRSRPGGGFEVTWTEAGGPTVAAPTRTGFGTTLLDQVTGRELHGDTRIDYRPSGVEARLRAGPQALAERPAVMPGAPPTRVTETVATASGPASLKGARILIVEDAVLLALELETGLSEAGATVVGPAYELEEAMALLDQPIDAAVLDANLNGHSVSPVAAALQQRRIPFIFATGYGDAGGAPGGFEAPVVRKPYDVTQITSAVAALLAAQ